MLWISIYAGERNFTFPSRGCGISKSFLSWKIRIIFHFIAESSYLTNEIQILEEYNYFLHEKLKLSSSLLKSSLYRCTIRTFFSMEDSLTVRKSFDFMFAILLLYNLVFSCMRSGKVGLRKTIIMHEILVSCKGLLALCIVKSPLQFLNINSSHHYIPLCNLKFGCDRFSALIIIISSLTSLFHLD